MEIDKNVIINEVEEKNISSVEEEPVVYLDVPVTRANAVATSDP